MTANQQKNIEDHIIDPITLRRSMEVDPVSIYDQPLKKISIAGFGIRRLLDVPLFQWVLGRLAR